MSDSRTYQIPPHSELTMRRTTYALIADHNGPCSLVRAYASLDEAIEAARTMDTDAAPTDLEDVIDYDATGDRDDAGLIAAAEAVGWRVVAAAPVGEYWTVMIEGGG